MRELKLNYPLDRKIEILTKDQELCKKAHAKNKEREDAISTQAVSAAVSQAGNASQQAQDQAVSVATTQAQQSVAVTDSIASMATSLYNIAPQQSMSNVGLNVQLNTQQSPAQQGVQASGGTTMGLTRAVS